MERAKQQVYTKKRRPDNTEQVFIGQEEVLSIIAEEQKNREAHEKVLNMYASDLDRYDEMMVREVKTKQQAIEVNEFIISRRNALRESLNSCDIPEYIGKYKEVILRAQDLIERSNAIILLSESKENTHLQPPLTRVLLQQEQEFLFDQLIKHKFMDGERESFYFVFGGTPIKKLNKIKWLKNKQTLNMLIDEVRAEKTSRAERVDIASKYFTDKKGQRMRLPRPKKYESNTDTNIMQNIILKFRQL